MKLVNNNMKPFDIEKACEWLKQLPPTWDIYEDSHYVIDRDSIISEFRKAMNE